MSKQQQWERKLLDLSLRNNLLNLRVSKNLLPLLLAEPEAVEDLLAGGKSFTISSGYNILPKKYPDELNFSNLHELSDVQQILWSDKTIYSPLLEHHLNEAIVTLYRTSRTSIEENGANTLYLAVGLMQWIEPKSQDKMRYAPLVLVPVELVRKSSALGYILRQRDEEVMLNTTLLEMLKQDFDIRIKELDPMPMDENGVDLPKIFSIFEQAIVKQTDWAILKSSWLGIFSFSQFVMWNDLHTRADDLAQNKLVKSLMDGKLAWQAEAMQLDEKISAANSLVPIPTDASQLYAIESASADKSFVLHGPPGTGKSQTITGIIANALAQGKTILFVAEKMAALSVVQKRMERLGLGAFCMELHSNKAKKKDVMSQLMVAAEATSKHNPAEYTKMANQISAMRKDLDLYADALHRKRASEFSFYEMVSAYEDDKNAKDVEISGDYTQKINRNLYDSHRLLIQELAAMSQSLGDVVSNPLRWIGLTQYDNSLKQSILPKAAEYEKSTAELLQIAAPIARSIYGKPVQSFAQLEEMNRILQYFILWNKLPDEWTMLGEQGLQEIYEFATESKLAEEKSNQLLVDWREEFFNQDAHQLSAKWAEISSKGFIGKFFGLLKLKSAVSSFARGKVDKHRLGETFDDLLAYQEAMQKINQAQKISNLLGNLHPQNDWATIAQFAEEAKQSLALFDKIERPHEARKNIGQNAADFSPSYEKFLRNKNALAEIKPLEHSCDDYLSAQVEFAQALQNKTDYIREWTQFNAKRFELQSLGLGAIADAPYQFRPEEFESAYRKDLFKQLIMLTLQDPILRDFSGASFNEKIMQFKKLGEDLQDMTKKEIFYRLASRVPNFTKEASQSSELGILQKAIRSNARGLSIRKLFTQIPTILPRLSPCMLMSPISCAQYLDVNHRFDLVIFDEASQLTTAKAVGVLARGNEAVIVGDPNQMPPTAFFTNNALDEENLAEEDLESILDDCLALSMPQTHLLWHYRSRHESLIAFSNEAFYESKLYTFPSANDQEKKVRLVASNGIFERGASRTNPIEAKMVVDEIIRRFQDPEKKNQSIGVVTFNIAQQSLIEDLLEEAYAQNAELDLWANEAEEALFVKNLENVQGDERDVILFSIGFGPDSEGKIYMNFGPLNQDGGWRRLNVAVTRSRHEMLVFSSLAPEDIDLSRTQARGVAALREFLAYARDGKLSTAQQKQKDADGIQKSIQEYLASKGYTVHHRVGHSKFKIDLAVLDPKNPSRYLLGIMLDGDNYRDAKTTSDRELSSLSVLRGLGWQMHRLWTIDYYENPQKELDKICLMLQKIERGMPIESESEQNSFKSKNIVTELKHQSSDLENETKISTDKAVFESKENDLKNNFETSADLETTAETQSETAIENPINPSADSKPTADSTSDLENQKEAAEENTVKNIAVENENPLYESNAFPQGKILEVPYELAPLKERTQTAATFTAQKNMPILSEYIATIIQYEAPISEEALHKKILKAFGITRANINVQSSIIHQINLLNPKFTLVEGSRYFWNSNQDETSYNLVRQSDKESKRDIEHIHPKELKNAIKLVLQEQIAIPQDALVKEASKKLGYARISQSVNQRLSDIVKELIRNGEIDNGNEMLKLK